VGTEVQFVKSIAAAAEKAREKVSALVIVDLNAGCCNPVELARAFKSDDKLNAISLLGFFSHVQIELQQAALRPDSTRSCRVQHSQEISQISCRSAPPA
jgi:hypothetical protein